jgi:Zn ribbon nucleic-acid-binding protein
MDCKLVPYGEEERRCVKCGYITWNNEKSDKEIIDDMMAAGYPTPACRKDLVYWKNNAEEDYISTPISVLRYISELEKEVKK